MNSADRMRKIREYETSLFGGMSEEEWRKHRGSLGYGPGGYNRVYSEFVSGEPDFQEAFEIIRMNSDGRAWLIGGAVYRNLAHLMHGVERAPSDFDFIVENPHQKIILPEGWEEKRNRYGNPKFVREGSEIDFVPLSTVNSIIKRGLDFTFENFLTGTPLTVQSIAYNIDMKRLEGEIGLYAVITKTIGINNIEQAKVFAEKKGEDLDEIIKEKADSLDFNAVLT